MCSSVMTCFITSMGHGEPAMMPENKEYRIELNFSSICLKQKVVRHEKEERDHMI